MENLNMMEILKRKLLKVEEMLQQQSKLEKNVPSRCSRNHIVLAQKVKIVGLEGCWAIACRMAVSFVMNPSVRNT